MTKTSVTLNRFFSLRAGKTPAPQGRTASPDRLEAFRERMKEQLKGIRWPATMPELSGKIGELLDIEIPDIMLSAWKKLDALKKSLDESRNALEEKIYLELAEHTIAADLHPYVEIRIKNIPVKKIEFTVKVALAVKGVILKLLNGRIREIRTGTCEVKGTVEYGDLVIAEKALEPIELPGSIELDESEGRGT